MSSVQRSDVVTAGPKAPESVYLSKIADKTSTQVSYSSDIAADWSTGEKVNKAKGKASVAGSLYYTASDSGSQSGEGSVYDAVSLPDSDKDFQIEVGLANGSTTAPKQAQAAPVVLFQGAGLASTTAAADSTKSDEEFDYVFENASREGASYERVFKPQPAPAHLISPLHQAHLTSLAEDSEEGSDQVSESDGGLIQDDDLPIEASPAASASFDQSPGGKISRSSAAGIRLVPSGKERAAAGTDGMFELDINDDFEQASGFQSFTGKSGQRSSHYAAGPIADVQPEGVRPAAHAGSTEQEVVRSSRDDTGASSSADTQSSISIAQQAQHAESSGQVPMPDSVPVAALSTVPILSPLPDAVASQPKAGPAEAMAGIDLEEIELGDAKEGLPSQQATVEGQAATDEWEEVNLARAKELAVDVPTAAIPGDKVRYPEALNYFLSADVKAIKKTLKKSKPAHRLVSCFMRMQKRCCAMLNAVEPLSRLHTSVLKGSYLLRKSQKQLNQICGMQSSKRLEKERTRLMCLAKMPFDDNDIMHLRLLQSVYLNFIGGPGPVGRYGKHWATLGFQGTDPTTDLRGCGILGLLHLLLLHEHDPANAQAIFKLASAKESEFPLAPVSLNITKWTLQAVRDRKLSSAAKKQQSAVTAASDFYTGTFYAFYNHWRDKKCTMAESGFVLKEVEKRATENVMNMVKRAGTKL